jgi:hypothetical protein
MRRIKYAAASSEKQEKPSSFVEVVERMTATKLLVNPKLLSYYVCYDVSS